MVATTATRSQMSNIVKLQGKFLRDHPKVIRSF